jgi:hypothetical protein
LGETKRRKEREESRNERKKGDKRVEGRKEEKDHRSRSFHPPSSPIIISRIRIEQP